MKRFEIGPGVTCDLDRLVDTRLLVQANSGGGKSWLLRRLLEQTHGHVQHLVIDPEGEFASLRERFDYVLAAKSGGDTAADPRSAALLAERLLELKVSAILDIYELKPHERIAFVGRFLEALVDAPKSLWHPALVVVDEAHVYCPEKGEAESAGAVKDLATRGRKRGFCALLATQRLSKLHKDAAAECNNKLIGRTSLDIDMDRAGDELGIKKGDRGGLRDLRAGEFYAFGPAFAHRGISTVQVGEVETTHPKAGARLAFTAPPPTSKVKALLPKLADLPAEQEERAKSIDGLKKENAQLRRELTIAAHAAPKAETKTVEKFVLKDGQLARFEQAVKAFAGVVDRLTAKAEEARDRAVDAMADACMAIEKTRTPQPYTHAPAARPDARPLAPSKAMGGSRPVSPPARPARDASTDGLTPAKQKILNGLAFLHGIGVAPADKTQLALIVGVSPTSGGYFNNLGALRSSGLIHYPNGGTVALTDAGAAVASTDGVPSSTEELHDAIRAKLPPAKWKILEALIPVYPNAMHKDALAERIGVQPTSGGYFNNLGSLRSLGLIAYPQPGHAAATPVLFLETA